MSRFSGLAERLTREVDRYQQLGGPNDVLEELLIWLFFTGIWTHSSCRLLLKP